MEELHLEEDLNTPLMIDMKSDDESSDSESDYSKPCEIIYTVNNTPPFEIISTSSRVIVNDEVSSDSQKERQGLMPLPKEQVSQFERVMCQICNRSYKTQSNLSRHLKTFHNQLGAYSCLFCSKTFKFEATRRTHHLQRHRDKYIECNFCFNTFVTTADLRRHLKLAHSALEAAKKEISKRTVGTQYSPATSSIAVETEKNHSDTNDCTSTVGTSIPRVWIKPQPSASQPFSVSQPLLREHDSKNLSHVDAPFKRKIESEFIQLRLALFNAGVPSDNANVMKNASICINNLREQVATLSKSPTTMNCWCCDRNLTEEEVSLDAISSGDLLKESISWSDLSSLASIL